MPKSKFYMSASADDDAPSLNGAITEEAPSPFPPILPTRKKAYSFGSSGEHTVSVDAGRLPEEVYTNMLPWWRAALRRKCVEVVVWESKVIGEWQVRSLFFSFSFPPQHLLLLDCRPPAVFSEARDG